MKIADRDDDVRSVVMVFGKDAAGIELEVGGADIVFHEQDVLGTAVQDVEAAVFVPLVRPLGFVASHEFDGYDLEGLVGKVFCGVSEGAGNEDAFAFLESTEKWRLTDDVVFDLRGAENGEDVVVPVLMYDHGGMGREVDLEGARVRVLEQKMMAGLRRDFDNRGCCLCDREHSEGQHGEEKPTLIHRPRF